MLKRLFLILLVLASVSVIVYTLWQTDVVETRQETLLHHVADDAVLILDVEDARGFHAKLKDGSVLWPDLQRIAWASHLDQLSKDIDSLLSPICALHPDSAISYILSLHPSGQEDFGWMLTVSLGVQTNIQNLLGRTKGFLPSTERKYNGSSIYTLSGRKDDFYAALKTDILHLSNSNLTIERTLRSESAKMMQDKRFLDSYGTRGKHSLAHVHVDWNEFPNVLRSLLPASTDSHMQPGFAGWATSDILTDANSVYIHGLVQASDSMSHNLSSYRQQGEGSYKDFLALCPSTTSSFSYLHISKHEEWAAETVDDSLVSCLGTGYLKAQLETTTEEDAREFFLIPIQDEALMSSWIEKHSGSTEDVLGLTCYADVECAELAKIFGGLDQKMKAYMVNDHLILSSRSSILKDILISQRSGRVLTQDAHFMQLNDDMDDEAALCHYFNVARSPGLIDRMASEEVRLSLGMDPTSLQQFQALVIQYAPASDGLFHQNVLLRHNPIYKKETSSLWEFEMDTLIQGRIHTLKNHYTDQFELLIQDGRQDLHLIDNTGRALWSLTIEEEIRSDVTQVDLYKNGKLQMAFNTDTRFIILDRNGKMLDGFPVMLSDTASSRLAVMDYDKKRKYRFLIATQDGSLHNFNKDGKAVKGWKYVATSEPIVGDIHHFLLGNKDYLSVIGRAGSLRFLERNGNVRYSAKEKPLSDYDGGPYRVEPAKNIAETRLIYMDYDGRIISSEVAGPFKVIEEEASVDLRIGSEYILHEDDRTLRFNSKGEEKLRVDHEFDKSGSYTELLHYGYLGIADFESTLYYLYDVEGKLVNGFPLPGQHALIKDMNSDGATDIILWDDRNVSMYSLSGK